MTIQDIDPIDLEVLRSRLETVGEQACRAVEQTAICPTVTESKDYSVTLLDAGGGLIVGSGTVIYHYGAAVHAVASSGSGAALWRSGKSHCSRCSVPNNSTNAAMKITHPENV